MNKEQFENLKGIEAKVIPPIGMTDLENQADRTLIYGYTWDRMTFHAYIKEGRIHVVTYKHDYENDMPKYMKKIPVQINMDYVPSKRLYPEACDYEFCKLLKEKGCDLPFLDWNAHRKKQTFYGYTLEDGQ